MDKKQPVTLTWRQILHLLVPLGFLLLILLLLPFRERFEFDLDEGINAMKALLLARGYSLYSEIWSDQPPLFTYLLSVIYRTFGPSIDAMRGLVLLFSAALVWAAYQFLRTTWGVRHALAGMLLILLLPYYKSLSVSVMIGLPAIALAGLSLLALITWHQRHNSIYLVLSALALGLSVLTKLFTGFLAPIFIIGILIEENKRIRGNFSWYSLLRPVFIWGLVFSGMIFILGLVMIGPSNLPQLINTHLLVRQVYFYSSLERTFTIGWYLRESWTVLILALLGCLFIILSKKWLSLYLVVWGVSAYLLLSLQVPVWYHHQLLVTFPAAMLAAIALGEAIHLPVQLSRTRNPLNFRNLLSLIAIVVFCLTLFFRGPQTYDDFTKPIHFIEPAAQGVGREQLFLENIYDYAEDTQWIVTDLPMYAFRVGLPVPPSLAVFTEKRMVSGNLNEQQVIDIVEEYKPEQVFIGRFKLPRLEQLLEENYQRSHFIGRRHLYHLRELQPNP